MTKSRMPSRLASLLPNAGGHSPTGGDQRPPERPSPQSVDAPTSTPTSPPASTITLPRAASSHHSTGLGKHGAETPSDMAGVVSVAGYRIRNAREVIAAAIALPDNAQMLTECLPDKLRQSLAGQRRTTAGRMEGRHFEPPSLNSPIWAVRITRQGFRWLETFIHQQGSLADLGTAKDRVREISMGRLAHFARSTAASSLDEKTRLAQGEVWWSALREYPPWVIKTGFLDVNAKSKFPPMPVEVQARCEEIWGKGAAQMRRARAAVNDVYEGKQEWTR